MDDTKWIEDLMYPASKRLKAAELDRKVLKKENESLREAILIGPIQVLGLTIDQIQYLKNFYEAQTGERAESLLK